MRNIISIVNENEFYYQVISIAALLEINCGLASFNILSKKDANVEKFFWSTASVKDANVNDCKAARKLLLSEIEFKICTNFMLCAVKFLSTPLFKSK